MNKFHAYRLALALNNLGVALAEKGQPAEALKAFEAALGITAQILRFHHEGHQGDGGPAFAALVEDAQRTFRKATRRIYHEDNHSDNENDKSEMEEEDNDQKSNKAPAGTKTAATSRRSSSSHDHQHERRRTPVCQVCTVDDDDLDALRSAALYGPSASVIFLIRIKSCDSICAANDLGENVTIFLHNLGATYSALVRKEGGRNHHHTTKNSPERASQKSKSSSSERRTKNKKAADRAHKFLSSARRGLTNLLVARSSSNNDDEDSPLLDLSTGLKTVIVLNALAGLHRTRQNVQRAQHVELEATQLLNVVASDNSFHSASERHAAAAA